MHCFSINWENDQLSLLEKNECILLLRIQIIWLSSAAHIRYESNLINLFIMVASSTKKTCVNIDPWRIFQIEEKIINQIKYKQTIINYY